MTEDTIIQSDHSPSKREPKTRRTGQVIRRGENRFMVRIYLGVDLLTKKRIYHNHTVRGTRKDADKYLTGKLRELDLGAFIEPTTKTLGQYFDEWLLGKRLEVTERTADSYSSLFETHLRKCLGGTRLAMLQASDIQKVYLDMLGRKLSARTVRHLHAVINAVLREAVKAKLLQQNSAEGVKLPKVEDEEQRHLTEEEATRFLAACAAMPNGLLFEFALATGMRPQEYLALKWRDIDFDRQTIRVVRALERHKGWRFKETKTAKSRRAVTLPSSLVDKLRQHKRVQSEHRLKLGSVWQQHDLVFCTEDGMPLDHRSMIDRYFRPILEKAGLSDATPYALRHSYATLLMVMGVNPKIVSEGMGHSTTDQTMNTYSHVLPTMQRGAVDKMEEFMYGEAKKA